MPTTAEINKILSRRSAEDIEQLIDAYIHNARNREIAKKKLIDDIPYEPLSERYGITPKQCFNIVKAVRHTIVQHIET